jgi:hypothetical protein
MPAVALRAAIPSFFGLFRLFQGLIRLFSGYSVFFKAIPSCFIDDVNTCKLTQLFKIRHNIFMTDKPVS